MGLIIGVVYISGVRYIKVNVTDELYVKFFGKIDDEGEPYKGKIIYSDGVSANVNLDEKVIEYSNGDKYIGELSNLMKNGNGELHYNSPCSISKAVAYI